MPLRQTVRAVDFREQVTVQAYSHHNRIRVNTVSVHLYNRLWVPTPPAWVEKPEKLVFLSRVPCAWLSHMRRILPLISVWSVGVLVVTVWACRVGAVLKCWGGLCRVSVILCVRWAVDWSIVTRDMWVP